MTTVSMLRRESCVTCREVTLHNARGCIHCSTEPTYGQAPASPTFRPIGPPTELAKARVLHLAARAEKPFSDGDIAIASAFAGGATRTEIARSMQADPVKISNRLEEFRRRCRLQSAREIRLPGLQKGVA